MQSLYKIQNEGIQNRLKAMRLGLSFRDMPYGHSWVDTKENKNAATETIRLLSERPKEASAKETVELIAGRNGDQIRKVASKKIFLAPRESVALLLKGISPKANKEWHTPPEIKRHIAGYLGTTMDPKVREMRKFAVRELDRRHHKTNGTNEPYKS